MKLELTNMPEGCHAESVTSEQTVLLTNQLDDYVLRVIGQSVCGDRRVEATCDYVNTGSFRTKPYPRDEALDIVTQDLQVLANAMCLGCTNRKPPTFQS